MVKDTERKFKNIKECLLVGYLSPRNLEGVLLMLFLVVLGCLGFVSFIISMPDTLIGWNGLALFWQGVLILNYILLLVQFIFLFVKGSSSRLHLILICIFLLSLCSLSLGIYLLMHVVFLDGYWNGIMNHIISIVFIVGLILLIGLLIDAFRINSKSEDSKSLMYVAKRHSVVAGAFVTLIIAYLWRDISYLGSNESIIISVGVMLLYVLVTSMTLPLQGIYCYLTFPAFRLEENWETIKAYELGVQEELHKRQTLAQPTVKQIPEDILTSSSVDVPAFYEEIEDYVKKLLLYGRTG